jgi:hypothetical protein
MRSLVIVGLGAALLQDLRQPPAVGVIADHAHAEAPGPQFQHVRRNARRAAPRELAPHHLQHLHRRLGADPQGVAVNIAVQHEIADQQHTRRA